MNFNFGIKVMKFSIKYYNEVQVKTNLRFNIQTFVHVIPYHLNKLFFNLTMQPGLHIENILDTTYHTAE